MTINEFKYVISDCSVTDHAYHPPTNKLNHGCRNIPSCLLYNYIRVFDML